MAAAAAGVGSALAAASAVAAPAASTVAAGTGPAAAPAAPDPMTVAIDVLVKSWVDYDAYGYGMTLADARPNPPSRFITDVLGLPPEISVPYVSPVNDPDDNYGYQSETPHDKRIAAALREWLTTADVDADDQKCAAAAVAPKKSSAKQCHPESHQSAVALYICLLRAYEWLHRHHRYTPAQLVAGLLVPDVHAYATETAALVAFGQPDSSGAHPPSLWSALNDSRVCRAVVDVLVRRSGGLLLRGGPWPAISPQSRRPRIAVGQTPLSLAVTHNCWTMVYVILAHPSSRPYPLVNAAPADGAAEASVIATTTTTTTGPGGAADPWLHEPPAALDVCDIRTCELYDASGNDGVDEPLLPLQVAVHARAPCHILRALGERMSHVSWNADPHAPPYLVAADIKWTRVALPPVQAACLAVHWYVHDVACGPSARDSRAYGVPYRQYTCWSLDKAAVNAAGCLSRSQFTAAEQADDPTAITSAHRHDAFFAAVTCIVQCGVAHDDGHGADLDRAHTADFIHALSYPHLGANTPYTPNARLERVADLLVRVPDSPAPAAAERDACMAHVKRMQSLLVSAAARQREFRAALNDTVRDSTNGGSSDDVGLPVVLCALVASYVLPPK